MRSAAAERDPYGTAALLIAQLGEQATCHATYEALKARQRGDRPRMDEWLWIAGATRAILRSEPEPEAATG
jgi:hypothetical protein